jgi:phage shock protein PspC (stress-responsive transcriptional regulator)
MLAGSAAAHAFGVSTTQRSLSNIEGTVKDFWETRPTRPRHGRMLAGVAAGIGRRYGVDPVLIRVALVVAAIFGGSGVAFYLLGWLFLRQEADEVSAIESLVDRGHSSVSKALTVVLCIALIPASGYLFGDFSTLIGTIVLFGGLYLLHHSRADYRPPNTEPVRDAMPPDVGQPVADADPYVDPMPGIAAPTVSDAVPAEAVTPDVDQPRATPPAWDPLGAAPFAWDLPEPQVAMAPPRRHRPRTKITLGTLGAAIVVAAVLAMVGGYTPWLTTQHIVGITLGVVGLGMVAGSFVRGGRGLIPFARTPHPQHGRRCAAGIPHGCWRRDARPDQARRPDRRGAHRRQHRCRRHRHPGPGHRRRAGHLSLQPR